MLFQITKKRAMLLIAGIAGLCLLLSSYLIAPAAGNSPATSASPLRPSARQGALPTIKTSHHSPLAWHSRPAPMQQTPPETDDFFEAAPQGLGNRENMWAWGMIWWNDHLYVGTSRNFDCADSLAQARNSFGIIVYPPPDPDLNCPEDPLTLDMRAEVWRYYPPANQWEQVYQSPVATVNKYTALGGSPTNPVIVTVPISPTNVAVDLGYRGMAVFTEPDGTEALYVTAISTGFIGYDVGAPRILRSTDGVHFAPLPRDPGTVLGDYDKTSMRNPVVHVGSDGVARLYVQGGSSRGAGEVFEATDPAAGNNNFRQISPEGMNVSALGSFNGYLYLGTHDRQNGFSLFKMDVDGGDLPYSYTTIMENGGYLPPEENPNNELLSMRAYDGALYVGGNGVRLSVFGADNLPAELFRVYPNDSWDVIVGLPRADTPDGPKEPLSGFGPGFGNDYNGHMWRMSVYEDALYVSTLDTNYMFKDDDPPPNVIAEMGFDLWRTVDGINFEPVTTDGFAGNIVDPTFPRPDLHLGAFDIGGRTQAATPYGLFIGTVNPFRGLRVWQSQIPSTDVVISGAASAATNSDASFTAAVTPLTATAPFTYTWSATDQPGTIVHQGLLTDTVSYAWDTPGVKTISLAVANRLGSVVNDSFNVTVQASAANTPPTTINLHGPDSGYYFETVTFTADVTPLNLTQPVTYTWTATDLPPQVSSGGANSVAAFTWSAPGVKSVTVTADNGVGVASANQTINILDCAPLTAVDITRQPGGEIYTDAVTVFQAQTSGGSIPISYAWRLNGNPIGSDSSQLVLQNAAAGIQSVTVTATNACSQQTASLPFLVYTNLNNQAELSPSSAAITPANVGPGDTLTVTVLLRNSDAPVLVDLINPIPAHTTYVPGSAIISHGEVALANSGLIWTGKIQSDGTVTLRFNVVVDADPLPAETPILNQTFLGSDVSRYNQVIAAVAYANAPYGLHINNDAAFTNNATVTLRYAWDMGSDISFVKFSNDAGFGSGPEANTSPWLPVNPDNPTYEGWLLPVNPPAFVPRTVYARFRSSGAQGTGQLIGPLVKTSITYDVDLPQVTEINITALLNPGSTPVILRITAKDATSSVATLDISNDPNFGNFVTVPATGNQTLVPWELLQNSSQVYVRARDEAGNLGEVAAGSATPVNQVAISGPTTGTVNTLYSFTANVLPITATLPVTYTWQTTGQPVVTQVGGTSSSVSYNWITPGVKTIQVTAANLLGTATDSHTITIQAPDIVVTPASLAESVVSGETGNATLTVQNNGGGTLNWSLGEIPPTAWLSASPTSGSLAGPSSQEITVTFDAVNLAAGVYNSTFRFQSNDPDRPILDLPVTLTVLPKGPILAIEPASLTLSVTIGQSDQRTLTLSNEGDQDLTWSVVADPDVPWLAVDVDSGSILPLQAQSIVVTLDTGDLNAGVYNTSLHFSSNDPAHPTADVPVTLTVTPVGPILNLMPATLAATVTAGEATVKTLILGNEGDQTLTWSLTENISWLSLNPGSGVVAPGGNTVVQATFNTANLAPGSYNAAVTLNTNDPQAPLVTIPVTLTVLPAPPAISVSRTSLGQSLLPGESGVETITISNLGGSNLTWSLQPVGVISWLTVAPGSGSLPANTSVNVNFTFNAAGLSPNNYTATIQLHSNDPDQSSIELQITLEVHVIHYEIFTPLILR